MRYPVTAGGSKQEFDSDWYVAQSFGKPTTYGFHDGADINLKIPVGSTGDIDLGQELKAIAPGKIVYYHYSSHPNTVPTFGRHLVLKIDGPWGTRWVHYAHCLDQDFVKDTSLNISEGQIIARIGKSGTPYAHLHFSVYKVDPVTFGIDNIPNNYTELNQYWEDPIKFIDTWMTAQVPVPTPVTDQSLYDFQGSIGVVELQKAKSIMREYETKIGEQENQITVLKSKIETAKNVLA